MGFSDEDTDDEEIGAGLLARDAGLGAEDAELGAVSSEDDNATQQEQPNSSRRKKEKKSKKNPKPPPPLWTEVSAENSEKQIPDWLDTLPEPNEVDCAIDYFRYFFDENIMATLVEQSNLYSVQKNPNKPLNLTVKELEQYFGICIGMSVYDLHRTRLYWAKNTRIDKIANVMSRDRWEQIKSNLHCNDNTQMRPQNDPNKDRLFKIRPLVDSMQDKFRSIPKYEYLCVDEQIVPYKGKSSLKMYNPKKPKKWGFKLFVLCDQNGLVYDFDIYCGKIQPVLGFPDIGASSNIVLKLVETIPRDKNYKLFFDNWFSSLQLFFELKAIGIESLGTIRSDRFPGLNFPVDSQMQKALGRGGYIEKKHENANSVEVRAVKWMDNRGVTLVSTFVGAQPLTMAKRYDKTTKREIDVPCPTTVTTYNKFMGGVDLLDGLVSYYRIDIRSRKYYMKLVYHFIDMAVVNSWLLYRRDCKDHGFAKKDVDDLLSFRTQVFEALCYQSKESLKRRGRPSAVDLEGADFELKKKRGPAKPVPEVNVRKDGIGHWPILTDDRQRCKKSGCTGITSTKCGKCNAHLCFTKGRNCFSSSFHGI